LAAFSRSLFVHYSQNGQSDSGGVSVAQQFGLKNDRLYFYREIGLRAPPRICDIAPSYSKKCELVRNAG
jgi:hypothetical protein